MVDLSPSVLLSHCARNTAECFLLTPVPLVCSFSSLEIGLMATEPDDALSFVFQKMVAALRNGNIRDMSCVLSFSVSRPAKSV